MIDVLRSQLLALKAQIDAMLVVIDSVVLSESTPPAVSCQHLETENIGTFGVPEFRCTMCKASVPAPV